MSMQNRFPTLMLAVVLALVGFAASQPGARAACDVNVGGICEGDCDVNVLSSCWATARCAVNVAAECGTWAYDSWASCFVNVAATCTGWCFANAGDASCSGSCLVNAGAADCSGWCVANAAFADCSGGCLVNAGLSDCQSHACVLGTGSTVRVEPVCFLWGCSVNVALATCGPTGACTVNVASDCQGGCFVNLASPALPIRSVPLWLGCGEGGTCTVNVAARCDGNCTVNALLSRCEATGSCDVNVLGTCRALETLLA